MVLDHLLASIQLQSFFEWTRTSFELSLAELHNVFLEEHLQVALEMLEVDLFLTLVFKTDESGSMVFNC
jgi:hypothetical protein